MTSATNIFVNLIEQFSPGVHAATNWLPFDGSQNTIFRLSFELNLSLNVFLIKVEYCFTTLKSQRIDKKPNFFKINHITKARKGHLKESRSVNFENFPSAPTMGAPVGLTIYVKTQSLLKNGSHKKWLHEALSGTPRPFFRFLKNAFVSPAD